ncbi:RNA-binding S4 domain-containing protein [Alicyclobacillus tolerans]|uniref:RNA-binding S4 domain-containing protein n=1 Tax=Alicyclobacillus tolerans TaxID=90970 RepID=UPI001F3746D1|nr:RNA-binding S4 domain-containing protein [Alicyclobacillus tolerans]MCF8566309.1 RNA-binding S4 domain-containing protein [Alicyclobacillus tolerans]
MRLDKYLKVSRLIKRRTVAKEICDAGRISVNGRVAKAGSEVSIGDVLTIRYGQRTLEVRVVQLLENPTKDAAAGLYEIIGGGTAKAANADEGF